MHMRIPSLLQLHKKEGTTIVEMMVAFGVFSIFITTAIGGFVYILRYQKLSLLMLEANESVGLAFEEIARDIRTAKPSTISDGNSLSFVDDRGRSITYALQGTALARNGSTITSESPAIAVQSFNTLRVDNPSNAKIPPRIVISAAIAVSYRGMQPIVTHLQTTVSPRLYYNFDSSE
jgi:type II secretory pathway pseudopilin PulG